MRRGKHLTKHQLNLLRKKNLLHRQLFDLERMRRADAQRVRTLAKNLAPKKKEAKKSQPAHTDKVAKIRNRLTGKKRESMDRWNRFAGTSDGGGRGR